MLARVTKITFVYLGIVLAYGRGAHGYQKFRTISQKLMGAKAFRIAWHGPRHLFPDAEWIISHWSLSSAAVSLESVKRRYAVKPPWHESPALFNCESPGIRLSEVALLYPWERQRTCKCGRACRQDRCHPGRKPKQ